MDQEPPLKTIVFTFIFCVFIGVMCLMLFSSCTISMQNISTHGTATDLVDENQSTDPQVKTNLKIPLK